MTEPELGKLQKVNRAGVVAPPQPMIARLLATLGTPKGVPESSTRDSAQSNFQT